MPARLCDKQMDFPKMYETDANEANPVSSEIVLAEIERNVLTDMNEEGYTACSDDVVVISDKHFIF